MTWALDNLGDLDFGQLVYSNYWETCVLKNLTHSFEAESISGLFFVDLYDLKSLSFKFGKEIIIDFEMPRSSYIIHNPLLENQHFVAIPSIFFRGP